MLSCTNGFELHNNQQTKKSEISLFRKLQESGWKGKKEESR